VWICRAGNVSLRTDLFYAPSWRGKVFDDVVPNTILGGYGSSHGQEDWLFHDELYGMRRQSNETRSALALVCLLGYGEVRRCNDEDSMRQQ
jgi:hypothetical protein